MFLEVQSLYLGGFFPDDAIAKPLLEGGPTFSIAPP